jgi:NAD(P)-dependent dehydrogenase (short-subunit alcohol dehydrogenase family)
MTPFHLNNKIILITGASSGIGQEAAISISKMGGTLVLTGRDKKKLEETLSLLEGSGHQLIAADLLNETERNKLIDEMPAVNGVVHSAGIVTPYPIKFIDQHKINETLNINYEIPVLLMAGIIRKKKILAKGSVVFLSSISAQHPHLGGTLYAGSKAALEAFSKVVALELFPLEVRSNCISPGMVKTPLYDNAEKEISKESMDKHVSLYPLGVGLPQDVANTIIFLLSDASRWITGINIILDGGYLLK